MFNTKDKYKIYDIIQNSNQYIKNTIMFNNDHMKMGLNRICRMERCLAFRNVFIMSLMFYIETRTN